jgi:transketolase
MAGWIAGIERRDGPVSLLLTRQNVPFQKRTAEQVAAIERGAYVLSDASGVARAVVIATGSEVALAIEAQKMLANENIPVRVVSMPSTSVFDRQDAAYRESVLPRGVPRIAVEAGVSDYWRKYVGLEGAVVGIDRYGESAPAADVFKFFGFTAENVVKTVKQVL